MKQTEKMSLGCFGGAALAVCAFDYFVFNIGFWASAIAALFIAATAYKALLDQVSKEAIIDRLPKRP